MSDLKVKLVLEAIDRLTQPIRAMTRRVQKFSQRMAQAFEKVGRSVMAVGRAMTRVGAKLTLRLTTPIVALGAAALVSAGQIEKMTIKFGGILRSEEKANKLVKELINFTANTPFQLEGVTDAAVKLLTAGTAAEDLKDKLAVLGDIAALADASMGDLGMIYGRVMSAQVAYTMELEMLADRGVPIWQELAKITGKSIREIRKETGNGLVDFKLFEQALENMRKEGGVAFEQMLKQSHGWLGLISTLRDNVKLTFQTIGESLIKTLELKQFVSGMIKGIQDLTEAFQKLPVPVQSFIVKGGIMLALLGPLLMGFGQLALGIGVTMIGMSKMGVGIALLSGFIWKTLIPALWGAVAATTRLSIAFLASPIGWITLGIAALAVAGFLIIKNWDKVKTFWNNLWDGITARVRSAIDFMMPLIDRVASGMSFITNNPIARGFAAGRDFLSGDSSSIPAQAGRVDTGGELRIVIDENRKTSVSAIMRDPNTTTTIDQGVLMGAAL